MKIAGWALAFACLAGAAQASPGFTTADVNMRAGPDTQYPRVTVLPEGAPVEIFGCLSNQSWCDVAWGPNRGWVYGEYLALDYRGERVLVPEYAPVIGIPVVGFNFGNYWGRYYRGAPWWNQYNRWQYYNPRPRPGWGVPPPGPGPRPPGWWNHPGRPGYPVVGPGRPGYPGGPGYHPPGAYPGRPPGGYPGNPGGPPPGAYPGRPPHGNPGGPPPGAYPGRPPHGNPGGPPPGAYPGRPPHGNPGGPPPGAYPGRPPHGNPGGPPPGQQRPPRGAPPGCAPGAPCPPQ
ncbi:SH3 domain-containing protein [Roseixanthobacter liquoris]|uniref:SH3 domain-containing protein n=1 Tax=Roseixanthobacter liquoris TaxID=3119921 RepID=UPI003726BA19